MVRFQFDAMRFPLKKIKGIRKKDFFFFFHTNPAGKKKNLSKIKSKMPLAESLLKKSKFQLRLLL